MLAADLHVHLDGSLRPGTILELARKHGMCPEEGTGADFLSELTFTDGMTLRSCLSRFEVTVGLLQSRAVLSRAAEELVRDCYLDGVRHIEMRLCPTLHTKAGLTRSEVVDAVIHGIDLGKSACVRDENGDWMSAGIIVTILQGSGDSEASELVDLAIRYAGSGVLGIDLAGDETLFDAARYERPLAAAKEAGLYITVHAGEGQDPSHIMDAVKRLGADRIGHGTTAARDRRVLELLAETGAAVECCLTSNLHTGAIRSIGEHPLPVLLSECVRATLATDNRFFSETTLSGEYDLAAEHLGLGREQLAQLAVESARASFLPSADRDRLTDIISGSVAAEMGRSPEGTQGRGLEP